MTGSNYIYGAYCVMSKSEVKFLIDKIKVVKVHDDGIVELEVPCFTSSTYSTNHFAEKDFEREFALLDNKYLFYSHDFIKCRNWIVKKRKKRIMELEEELNMLKQADKIEPIGFN